MPRAYTMKTSMTSAPSPLKKMLFKYPTTIFRVDRRLFSSLQPTAALPIHLIRPTTRPIFSRHHSHHPIHPTRLQPTMSQSHHPANPSPTSKSNPSNEAPADDEPKPPPGKSIAHFDIVARPALQDSIHNTNDDGQDEVMLGGCIDESMIRYMGRAVAFVQYMPRKQSSMTSRSLLSVVPKVPSFWVLKYIVAQMTTRFLTLTKAHWEWSGD
jgi:hypothetical protein